MLPSLFTFTAFAGLAITAAAKDRMTALNLMTDVAYEPAEAWHHTDLPMAADTKCRGLTDHYTMTLGANMTFQFEGAYGSV